MDKIPPHNIDAEIAVLGSLLIENSYHEYIDSVNPEFFYNLFHQEVFKAIQKLHSEKKNIDILTVSDEVKYPVRVSELTKNIAGSSHFPEHLAIVIENYLRRSLIKKSGEMFNNSFDLSMDVEDIIQELNKTNIELSGLIYKNCDIKTIQEVAKECYKDANIRKKKYEKNEPFGISIPLGALQKVLGGWHHGELTILAARPSMGKTALALKFATHAAYQGYKVLFVSIEMSAKLLVDRVIVGKSEVNAEKYKNGNITNFDISLIEKASSEIEDYQILIADEGSINVDQIYTMIKKHKPDIVFVDYVQLIGKSKGVKAENRNQEIGQISRRLKAASKDFNIPVIALSQLNRGVEIRANKRPKLSDLRESGDLEQDADIVIFLYRNSYYDKDDVSNNIELLIKKNRNGRTGFVECKHNDTFTDFWDVEI
jgi:replicative DNA helicase